MSKSYPSNVDIIQLCQANPGWELHYDEGNFTVVRDVACFALHRNGAMCALWCDESGRLRYPDDCPGFKKCVYSPTAA